MVTKRKCYHRSWNKYGKRYNSRAYVVSSGSTHRTMECGKCGKRWNVKAKRFKK